MATDTDGGKRGAAKAEPGTEAAKPRWNAPRPIGRLVPPLTQAAFRRRAPASAAILLDWAAIVGPALAAVTAPRRLGGTTLTIACAGPTAMELQHTTAELMARINGHLGRVAVDRLRFVQDAVTPPALPAPKLAPPPPPPELPGIEAGPLHDALARLGQAVARDGRRR